MEVLRSEHWRSISYCCRWGGRRVSRGPNPLLQAKLGGLRLVPVPWLTSSKPTQMSWSPFTHTHPSATLKNPLSSNSLLTPQPKQSTQVISLITRALAGSLNWYLWYLISLCSTSFFLFLGPYVGLLVLRGACPGVGCPLTVGMVRFLNEHGNQSVTPHTPLPHGCSAFSNREPRSRSTGKDNDKSQPA